MKITKECCLMTCLLLAAYVSPVHAGVITKADSVTTTMGSWASSTNSFDINNIINESGLVTPYASGIDDFDTYLASSGSLAKHDYVATGNEWFADHQTTGSITFDLGSAYNIDKIAIWNEDSQGIAKFNLFSSTDNISWVPIGGPFTASDNDIFVNYTADVFTLPSTTLAQYVRIDVLTTYANTNQPGFFVASLGEVAFSTTKPVPEPASLLLLGSGLLGLAGMRRKKK